MKKLFALIIVCICILALVACGSQKPVEDVPGETGGSASVEPNASNTPDAPAEPTEDTSAQPETPTQEPTEAPTEESTEEPTEEPTEAPTEEPSEAPTGHTHSYTVTVTAPGCEDGGQTTHTCACGDSYVTDKTAALGHKFGEWVTVEESTALKHGTAERACAACGKTESKQLDKLPMFHTHTYTDKVVSPTCTTEGYTVHTCDCGHSYVDTTVPKTAHTYTKTVTDPTCTAEGYTTYKCACGDSYIGDKTAKTAHAYTDTVTKPTCTADGYTTHKCTKCGGTKVDTKVPATGHAYSETVVAPTCETPGYTAYTCSACGHSYQGNQQPATGHVNTQTDSKPADCTYDGWEKVVCTDCGATLSETTIPANGQHSIVTMRLSDAANKWPDFYSDMAAFKEHSIKLCEHCGDGDLDTITCIYSQTGAAEVMLGYVNALRESVYGTSEYNLVLDSRLVELANIRAKEISTNYSHSGMRECDGENIGGGKTIWNCYSNWYNSNAHRQNMLVQKDKYFGFGWYFDVYTTESPYAVQLFKK